MKGRYGLTAVVLALLLLLGGCALSADHDAGPENGSAVTAQDAAERTRIAYNQMFYPLVDGEKLEDQSPKVIRTGEELDAFREEYGAYFRPADREDEGLWRGTLGASIQNGGMLVFLPLPPVERSDAWYQIYQVTTDDHTYIDVCQSFPGGTLADSGWKWALVEFYARDAVGEIRLEQSILTSTDVMPTEEELAIAEWLMLEGGGYWRNTDDSDPTAPIFQLKPGEHGEIAVMCGGYGEVEELSALPGEKNCYLLLAYLPEIRSVSLTGPHYSQEAVTLQLVLDLSRLDEGLLEIVSRDEERFPSGIYEPRGQRE